MADVTRPTLGPYMSITCFHYLRQGAEDAAGRALIITSGRKRGMDLIKDLGLAGSTHDPAVIAAKLNAALGPDGTKLCIVSSITAKPNGGFEVRIREGACTAGVSDPEPHCAFTMGVFIGAMTAITGDNMIGKESACSAQGGPECVYQIDPFV